MIAQVTPAEVVSGVVRRRRERSIAPRTARAIRLLIDRHARGEDPTIALQPRVLHRAEDLLDMHTLRAYDAVQLASAPKSNDRLVAAGLAPLVFVSADTHLPSVASSAGLVTDDPTAHP